MVAVPKDIQIIRRWITLRQHDPVEKARGARLTPGPPFLCDDTFRKVPYDGPFLGVGAAPDPSIAGSVQRAFGKTVINQRPAKQDVIAEIGRAHV